MPANEIQSDTLSTSISTLRLYITVAFMINLAVLVMGIGNAYGLGSFFGFSGGMLLALWPYLLILLVSTAGIIVLNTHQSSFLINFARSLFRAVSSLGSLNFILFTIPILLLSYYYLKGIAQPTVENLPDIWVFGNLGLLGAFFLSGTRKIQPSNALLASFSIYSLILGGVYYIPDIFPYPLSVGWSETSRYYDASLFFSRLVYGKRAPLPSLDPTRAFLQSLPFMIPSLPIWAHRLWKVVLWLGISLTSGFALTRRMKLQNRWISLGLAVWFFIFSLQGPVYYHLMAVVIIVLLGFDKNKLWRSLFFVGLASLWAGVSRVNWFPMAGVLAATLYVLEVPRGKKSFWQYARWPVFAVILGLVLAFAAQAGYAAISGNPPEAYTTSFNSPLFWYRLFPNEAYGPGVINLTITASFPLWLIILWRVLPRLRNWWGLRLLTLSVILIALLGAGLIVSTKIGGGNNLHNLDSYLVTLAVIATYLVFNRFEPDNPATVLKSPLPSPLIVLAFLVPLVSMLNACRPYPILDEAGAWEDIQQLQAVIDGVSPEDGEVLFIQNRHLLAFGMIEGVDLVPEYEKVFLMEMAMSDNEVYLEQFWQDLENHRFSVIVTEPLALVSRTSSDDFGEENNAWVERVARPLTASYHTVLDLSGSGMFIMVPNEE